MLSWDESKPEPIVSDEIYEIGRVTLGPRMSTPFKLVPKAASVSTITVEPLTFPHYSVQTPFVLIPDVDEVQTPYVDVSQTPYVDDVHTSDVQYVIRGVEWYDSSPPKSSDLWKRRPPRMSRDYHHPEEIDSHGDARVIPFSLHQKVKFIHDGQIVTVQSVRDVFISAEPVLQICHSDDDLFLTGFTFDETHSDGIIGELSPTQEAEFQHLVHQLQLSDGAPSTLTSALATPSSPNRKSLMMLYFSDEINEHGTFAEIGDIVDGAIPHDEYVDEMLAMSMSQIDGMI
ncbi:hypothetical protein AAG906_016371 [Vitis piasezkii]